MKNMLARSMMVLATIAMVVSLVAALTPDASAQDSGTTPDGLSKWMRYNMPAAQGLEAAANANFISQQKTCCIMVSLGTIPSPDAVIGGTASTTVTTIDGGPSRWFCMSDPR